MNTLRVIVVFLSVTVVALASPAVQCKGFDFDKLTERITVSNCQKTRCKLLKEQNTTVTFFFRPEQAVNSLINNVEAKIGGIPLPFIGVTGTSACNNIYHEDGKTPAPCPLEPNLEYVYSNAFYVEPIYPEVGMTVKWSLDDGNTKVICFEIPAVITKKRKT